MAHHPHEGLKAFISLQLFVVRCGNGFCHRHCPIQFAKATQSIWVAVGARFYVLVIVDAFKCTCDLANPLNSGCMEMHFIDNLSFCQGGFRG